MAQLPPAACSQVYSEAQEEKAEQKVLKILQFGYKSLCKTGASEGRAPKEPAPFKRSLVFYIRTLEKTERLTNATVNPVDVRTSVNPAAGLCSQPEGACDEEFGGYQDLRGVSSIPERP